jgi:hypothetical protein
MIKASAFVAFAPLLIVCACVFAGGARAQSCPSQCTAADDLVLPGAFCPTAPATARAGSICALLVTLSARVAALEAAAAAPAPPQVAQTASAELAALSARLASAEAVNAAQNASLTAAALPSGTVLLFTASYASASCPPGYATSAELNERYLAATSDGTKRGTRPGGAALLDLATHVPSVDAIMWSSAMINTALNYPTRNAATTSSSVLLQTHNQRTVAPFAYVLACVKQ